LNLESEEDYDHRKFENSRKLLNDNMFKVIAYHVDHSGDKFKARCEHHKLEGLERDQVRNLSRGRVSKLGSRKIP